MKKNILIATTLALAGLPGLWANTAPTVVIHSAAMRPGTTFMDIVFRVNDPDDATVKTRALAFKDGVRSFANVIKPTTFVEGTGSKIGDSIPANSNHTITWDVAADWDVQLGQVKFEVLAMDGRGLLPFEWITIPAVGGSPALTVSKNSPTDTEVLNALFWRYVDGDTGLSLENGLLSGNPSSGVFNKVVLVNGGSLQAYATPFIFKRMNLDSDDGVLAATARAGLTNPQRWHATSRPYTGVPIMFGWGYNSIEGQTVIPAGLNGVTAIAAGAYHSIALRSDGTVVGWGRNDFGATTPPAGLSGVVAIAAGGTHCLALKSDGTVVGWGYNDYGQATIPIGLAGVTAIAAGQYHSLALKSDGTVVGWGYNYEGPTTIPVGLNNVISISAGQTHSLALKRDGTVVGWGSNAYSQNQIPAGLRGVIAIDAGAYHNLALKSDGTVITWGYSGNGLNTIPAGLSGVTSISAGFYHSLALKSDGKIVAWGKNDFGQTSIPEWISEVDIIAAGGYYSLALKRKAP